MSTDFETIWKRAAERKGGEKALRALLPAKPKSKAELRQIPDDRWLAQMTRSIFQAGFSWKTVHKMWPGFEAAFEGFDPHRLQLMSDDDFHRLVSDRRIVRHGPKIRSVQRNAEFIVALKREHGSAGTFFAEWPPTEFAGLLETLKKRGHRLGGQTGQYFLRSMGVDGFILSRDGVAALIDAGIVDKAPSGKSAMAAVQSAYNLWAEQSGLQLTTISRVLSLSIGENMPTTSVIA